MLHYVKILLSFILTIVMEKNDYNFFHKNFKPIRVVIITALVLNVPFTWYLMDVLHDTGKQMEKMCKAEDFKKEPKIKPDKKT